MSESAYAFGERSQYKDEEKMKFKSTIISYLVPHLQDIVFLSVFSFILLFGSNLFRDGDPGRHITIGRYFIEHQTILTHDIFSYTMYNQPFTPQEWLAQVAYGGFYMLLGMNGVILLSALLISIMVVLVYREIIRRGVPYLVAFILALWCAAMTSAHWLARPHLFTLLYIVIWTPRLIRLTKGEAIPLWQFPLLMLFWANTHGAFIAGFVIWGIIFAGWIWENFSNLRQKRIEIRNLLIVGGTSLAVTFINPVGWRLWMNSISYITNRYLTGFSREYRSLDYHSIGAWPFLLFITVAFFVLTRNWKKIPLSESLLIAGWLPLALYSGRNMPILAVISTPIMASYLLPAIENSPMMLKLTKPINTLERQLRGFVWSFVIVILVIFYMATGHTTDFSKKGYQFNSTEFPVEAVNWLESHPQTGNMYNDCGWGGYIIFRMWPNIRVFIDSQTDFYGEQFTRQYEQIFNADEGWREDLKRYNIQWMLVPPDSNIAKVLQSDPNWSIIYQDQTAVIIRQH
jgi:hypothetical protein